MKKFINSEKLKWFRQSLLEKIRKNVLEDKDRFCCNVRCWESVFICWKDLKEVEENLSSKYIRDLQNWSLDCRHVWFDSKEDRLAFLKECISKIN